MSFLNTSYNKCALVIGINYTGIQGAELNGCITDTKRISDFLRDRCSYSDNNIDLLTDDTLLKPTKQNIINAIKKFVQKIKDDDIKEAWFSYSGHGSYLNNNSVGDEVDYQDEALVPLDFYNSGLIRDDDLYNLLVKMIPKDCYLFCIENWKQTFVLNILLSCNISLYFTIQLYFGRSNILFINYCI